MKKNFKTSILFIALILSASSAFAQTTAFTYQGKLTDGAAAASGTFEMRFALFNALIGGVLQPQPGPTILDFTVAGGNPVTVTNGIFTVQLDFTANAFPGANRFLEIHVRRSSTESFTPLVPRQPLTSSPYSLRSLASSSADGLSPACSLCVTDAHIVSIDGSKITGTVANATTAGNVTGVVPIENGGTGSSTKNFVDLSSTQREIGGNKQFTGEINVTGEGRFVGNGSGLTNVTPADGSVTTPKIADGSVTRAKLAADYGNGFDPQNVALMRWDQIPVVPNVADVGRTPSALAFDGTFMYVANKLDNNVMRIRTSTGLIAGSPIPVGNGPVALVYDGFRSIWVANSAAGTLSRISILNAAVDLTVSGAGTTPCALAFDGTLIYVADCASDKVTRITKTGVVVGGITVGHKSVSLAFDGTYMYVTEPFNETTGIGGRIRRILASTGAVQLIASPGLYAGALAFDGTFIYVAHGSKVERIRSSTGVFESRAIVVLSPLSLNNAALVFDGTFLYASGVDVNAAVVRLNTNGLTSERNAIPTQGTIKALAFDGTYIYAASDRIFNDPDTGMTIILNGAVTRF